MCVRVCVYACARVSVCACVCVCTNVYVYVYVYACVRENQVKCSKGCLSMRCTRVCVCKYVRVCICMCVRELGSVSGVSGVIVVRSDSHSHTHVCDEKRVSNHTQSTHGCMYMHSWMQVNAYFGCVRVCVCVFVCVCVC